MNKIEFIAQLSEALDGLPEREVEERISFYCEMIDDRIEEGASEENAVAAIGTVEEIAAQIIAEVPLSKIVKEKIKARRKLHTWEVVLLALGSPLWLSLLIAALAVVISGYAVLWSVVAAVWAVEASLMACAVGGVVAGGVFSCVGYVAVVIAMFGAALVCAGLSIFGFFGCLAATKHMARLTKLMAIAIKRCFIRKKGEA